MGIGLLANAGDNGWLSGDLDASSRPYISPWSQSLESLIPKQNEPVDWISLLCVCWLVVLHLFARYRLGRHSLVALLVGLAGAPVLVVAVRLLTQ